MKIIIKLVVDEYYGKNKPQVSVSITEALDCKFNVKKQVWETKDSSGNKYEAKTMNELIKKFINSHKSLKS